MFTSRVFFAALASVTLFSCLATSAGAQDEAKQLQHALAAERAKAIVNPIARNRFLVRPAVRQATLSPDGRHVAYLHEQGKNLDIGLLDTADGKSRRLLQQNDIASLSWSRDNRWLLLESSRQLFAIAVAGQAGTGTVATLGGRDKRTFQSVDPVFPAAVLVIEETNDSGGTGKTWRLVRIDMRGKRSVLHEDKRRIVDFAFDSNGRLSFIERVEDQDLVIHRIDAGNRAHEIKRCAKLQRCSLLPISGEGNRLFVQGNLDGNRSSLFVLNAKGMQKLHEDPRNEADIDDVVLDPLTQQPLIVSYRSTLAVNYGLTPEMKLHIDRIDRQFPQSNLRIDVARGKDAYWLLNQRSSTLQGERWHLYDPESGRVRRILDESPLLQRSDKATQWLSESMLSKKISFAYTGLDGMRLYGFLTLPPGRDPKTLPLIANVHGGPWNNARPEYNTTTQFLANRGYAVFEPNFRGSTGHGRYYMFAARGDFGNGLVQSDIVEGVKYLTGQGIGDANRVGITGASFGGYSTLLGVTFQPDVFKVGVAIVPPPEFGWDLQMTGRSREALNISRYIPYENWLRVLSLDLNDTATMSRLHAQSPLANVEKMNRPLLLLASGEDRRVPIRGVIEYAARLRVLGKDVSLVVDADAGHANTDPLAREANLYLLESMMQHHLGGIVPEVPDKALRAYLDKNLRIAGKHFPAQAKP